MQSLTVTFPNSERMDPHGVNPKFSIIVSTPSSSAMQDMEATAQWGKDIPILLTITLIPRSLVFIHQNQNQNAKVSYIRQFQSCQRIEIEDRKIEPMMIY